MTSLDGKLTTPPESNQIELSIFGPGIGECIVLHLGNNKWVVIDSCKDKSAGIPAAIKYLKELQVNPSSSVKLFIVTHWDDDHIGGASEILAECSNARFCCSCALLSKEFLKLTEIYSERSLMISSGTDEFWRIFQILLERRQGSRKQSAGPVWAKADTVLLETNKESHCFDVKIRALSPSDGALTLAFNEIAQLIPNENVPRRRAVAQKSNHVSVALWITIEKAHILLGADLENHPNQNLGWQAVLFKHDRSQQAAIVKVPHHGSFDAYSSEMWNVMAVPDPIALLTPFASSVKPLPSQSDVKRIQRHTSQVFCTGRGIGWHPIRRNSAVERTIRETVRTRRLIHGPMGHVRVRYYPNAKSFTPTIETFKGALLLK